MHRWGRAKVPSSTGNERWLDSLSLTSADPPTQSIARLATGVVAPRWWMIDTALAVRSAAKYLSSSTDGPMLILACVARRGRRVRDPRRRPGFNDLLSGNDYAPSASAMRSLRYLPGCHHPVPTAGVQLPSCARHGWPRICEAAEPDRRACGWPTHARAEAPQTTKAAEAAFVCSHRQQVGAVRPFSAATPPTCRKTRPCQPGRASLPACSRYRSRRPHRYPASA